MKRHLGTRRLILTLTLVFTFIAAIVTAGVSCTTADTLQPETPAVALKITLGNSFSTVERSSMLVLYLLDGNYYLMTIKGTYDFWVEGDTLCMYDGRAVVNDINVVGWRLYPEQKVEIPTGWDEELQMDVEVPVTLEELNLRDFTADDLPRSGHFARLDAVYLSDALKAEVSRFYYGEWFSGIRCLVTLSVLESYQAEDIEIGDYVWVYYTNDPRPGHEHEEVPIIIDKIMEEVE